MESQFQNLTEKLKNEIYQFCNDSLQKREDESSVFYFQRNRRTTRVISEKGEISVLHRGRKEYHLICIYHAREDITVLDSINLRSNTGL